VQVNIHLSPPGPCSEYIDDEGKKQTVSIVVSPLTLTANEEQSKMVFQTGCNLWKSCHNEGCYYSLASRQRK